MKTRILLAFGVAFRLLLASVSGQSFDFSDIAWLARARPSSAPATGTNTIVSYYRLQEEAGTNRVDTVGGVTLVEYNVMLSTNGVAGNAVCGQAGGYAYLQTAETAKFAWTNKITYAFWFTTMETENNYYPVAGSGFEFMYTGTNVVLYQSDSEVSETVQSGEVVTGTWYFVAGGYDGTNVWISTTEYTSADLAARVTEVFEMYSSRATQRLTVGTADNGSGGYPDGSIDEVMVFQGYCPLSEMEGIFDQTKGGASWR